MAALVEQLKLLSLPAPGKIDIDDFENDVTSARVIEKDDVDESVEVNGSNLRKTAAILSDEDERYVGKTVSREELSRLRGHDDEYDIHSDDDVSGNEDKYGLQNTSNENFESDEAGSDNVDEIDLDEVKASSESCGDNEGEVENELEELAEGVGDLEEEARHLVQSHATDINKGKSVVNQIALWDSLLENRIRLQKILVEVNKMPQNCTFDEIKERGGRQIKEPLNNTQQLLINMLHNMFILQQTLCENNTNTSRILSNHGNQTNDSGEEDIPSDDNEANNEMENYSNDGRDELKTIGEDNEILKLTRKRKHTMSLEDYADHIKKRHAAFQNFQDTTIKRWNEKTRLASGKVSNKSFNAFDRSTLNQIRQILNDKERLIERTQLKRSSYRVFGKLNENEEDNWNEQRDAHLKNYDTEIFDDDDFYHQLLREFIERKSNVDLYDPIAMGRQWLEIQRLRNKVKRKVDTKASKGRRLRYDVHTKLVSFMAPHSRGTMTDSSRNELFSSLFGKRQPVETGDISLFLGDETH